MSTAYTHLLRERGTDKLLAASSSSSGIRNLFLRHVSLKADIERCALPELEDGDIPQVVRIELDKYGANVIVVGLDVLRGWLL